MTIRTLFIAVAVVLAAAGLYYRAQNANQAHQQATALTTLDTSGGDTTSALAALKTFVASHMGASVSFTLTGSYQRGVTAANAAAAVNAANAQVYAAAQAACSGHTDSITQAECNQKYLSDHLKTEPAGGSATQPALSAYQYKLTAPLWTPDLAGALLLGAAAAAAVAVWYRPRRPKTRRHA